MSNRPITRANEALSAFLIVFMASLLSIWLWPAAYWMDVRSVEVRDDLTVVVNRAIRHGFVGHWQAEVVDIGGGTPSQPCEGSGESTYSPREGAWTGSLDVFVGARCALPPGCFIVNVSWKWDVLTGLVSKEVVRTSNPFGGRCAGLSAD